MKQVPLFRIYVLRALYLLIGIGLGASIWPNILNPARHWELMEGVETCMLAAFSLLCLLGLRYPLQMLPILLWEVIWKTLWLLLVPFPQWRSGHVDASLQPTLFAVSLVVLVYLAIPWRYVWRQYAEAPGDRWRSSPNALNAGTHLGSAAADHPVAAHRP